MLSAIGTVCVESFVVRKDHEWAVVFIRYGADDSKIKETGRIRYYGTLAINSSFGPFAYGWTHCGVSFPKFLTQLDRDYLLSKISSLEMSERKMLASVRRELLKLRKYGQISRQQARDAWDCVDELEAEGLHPQTFAHMLYHSWEIPSEFDFTDLDTMDWPSEATGFYQKLWPAIVEHMKAEVMR